MTPTGKDSYREIDADAIIGVWMRHWGSERRASNPVWCCSMGWGGG